MDNTTELVAIYNNLLLAWTQIQKIRIILKKKQDFSKMVSKTSPFRGNETEFWSSSEII